MEFGSQAALFLVSRSFGNIRGWKEVYRLIMVLMQAFRSDAYLEVSQRMSVGNATRKETKSNSVHETCEITFKQTRAGLHSCKGA